MLAGRPHEAVGNGSPRWMTAAPRKRGAQNPAYRPTHPPRVFDRGIVTMPGSTGFRPRKGFFYWLSSSAGHGGQGTIGH